MAVAFGSFNRSPLGAFIRSPLGARGSDSDPEDWFLEHASSNNYFTSLDGVNWTTVLTGDVGNDMLDGIAISKRLMGNQVYRDLPYTSTVAMKEDGTSLVTANRQISEIPMRGASGRRFSFTFSTVGFNNKLVYTDNDFEDWTTVTAPTPTGGTSFIAWCGLPLVTLTGRVMAMMLWSHSGTTKLSVAYSDDNGATWAAISAIVDPYTSGNGAGFLYQYPTGDIWWIPRTTSTQRQLSTDNGATWTPSGAAGSSYSTEARHAIAFSSGRVYLKDGFYSDDNFATRTTTSTSAIQTEVDGTLYRYNATTDKIEISTDEGSTFSALTTSPTTLVSGSGLLYTLAKIQ